MAYYPAKARTWHLRDASSDISGYKRLVMLPQTVETEATLTGASNSSAEVLIGVFVSDVVGVTSLAAGVWRLNLKAKVDSTTDVTTIKAYVYSRDSSGDETELFNATGAEINNTTVGTVTILSSAQSAFTVAVTDRVVIKLYALSDSGTDKTVTLYYQGDTNYSTVLLPSAIPVREGDMTKAVYDADGDGTIVSGGGGGHVIQDEGTPLTQRANLNFAGDNVEVTDDGYNDATVVTISGSAPAAHHTTHESGGTDAIKLDDLAAPDDNTDLNASTTAHGLLPKLSNVDDEMLSGIGAWTEALIYRGEETDDVNNCTETGYYLINNYAITNSPGTPTGFLLVFAISANYIVQIFYPIAVSYPSFSGTINRRYISSESPAWSPWTYQITERNFSNYVKLDTVGSPTDITTNNASITKHGLLPKLSNVAAQFLNGVGSWIAVNWADLADKPTTFPAAWADITDKPLDGWTADAATWTRASATTFTVTGNVVSQFPVGTKIKLTQTTVKYFYVTGASYGAPNTTVTVTGGSDYTLEAAAITSPYYSYAATPQVFPQWFNWAPSYSASASMTWTSVTTTRARFAINGRALTLVLNANGTTDGTADKWLMYTLPVAAANVNQGYFSGILNDGSSTALVGMMSRLNSTTIVENARYDFANFGLGATRVVRSTGTYEI